MPRHIPGLAAARVEDALFLLDQGVDPAEVVRRVGYASMEIALRRHGHPRRDLMRLMYRERARRTA